MNKREHLINAIALGAGIGYLVEPGTDIETLQSIAEFGVPITLGTMIPDIDTALGRHRKTFHNGSILLLFMIFPVFFQNLKYIWIGVLSHYVLDLLGTNRGMAVFYPLTDDEFEIPIGVPVNSILAPLMTIIITVASLVVCWLFLSNPQNPIVSDTRAIFDEIRNGEITNEIKF